MRPYYVEILRPNPDPRRAQSRRWTRVGPDVSFPTIEEAEGWARKVLREGTFYRVSTADAVGETAFVPAEVGA